MSPETRQRWMAARYKHGGYAGGKERPEHYVWRTMIARCTNPNNKQYHYYGGRGITVCKRWLKYEHFIADMGARPSNDHSLERKNTDAGYKPSNCCWATRSEQQKNKTITKLYTDGVFVGTLVECADYVGISKALALWRWKTHATFQKGQTWRKLPKSR